MALSKQMKKIMGFVRNRAKEQLDGYIDFPQAQTYPIILNLFIGGKTSQVNLTGFIAQLDSGTTSARIMVDGTPVTFGSSSIINIGVVQTTFTCNQAVSVGQKVDIELSNLSTDAGGLAFVLAFNRM